MPVPSHPQPATSHPAQAGNPSSPASPRRRTGRGWFVVGLLLVLLLLAIFPPLLSISRYQRRVATSMSQVLGRPVHLDHVSLNLLPFPSITLTNLVIDDLPPFGDEPMIRANSVNARLRLLSLWRHRVEFSRITFTDPSVNLVRLHTGRWNLESILLQTAHLDTAPTSERHVTRQLRFPYIEATGARVNLKLDQQKTPFALTEADFALWLPEPGHWRLRLSGHPARTDTDASDTGTVQLEGSLERASAARSVPISIDGTWSSAPMGEATRILLGYDANLRGNLRFVSHLQGTLDQASLRTELILSGLRREDLVPDRPVDVDLTCHGELSNLLHTLSDLRCAWPIENTDAGMVRLTGSIPSLLDPASADLHLAASDIPANTVLHWLRASVGTLPPDLRATGSVAAEASYNGSLLAAQAVTQSTTASASTAQAAAQRKAPSTTQSLGQPAFSILLSAPAASATKPQAEAPPISTATQQPLLSAATVHLSGLTLSGASLHDTPVTFGPILLSARDAAPAVTPLVAAPPAPQPSSTGISSAPATPRPALIPLLGSAPELSVAPVTVQLGTADAPAGTLTLSLGADRQGFSARLAGTAVLARLRAFAAAFPPLGSGLADALPPPADNASDNPGNKPIPVDLAAHRPWDGHELWINLQDQPASATPKTLPHHHAQ